MALFNLIDYDISETLGNEFEINNSDLLNCKLKDFNTVILHVNIRSLNANLALLETYINNLIEKPLVIVCSETWNLIDENIYNISGYNIFYNKGKINKADGVVVFIKQNVEHTVETITFDLFQVLNCHIKIFENFSFGITAMYRCHDLEETIFLNNLKQIMDKNKSKHHFIVGDFNINILESNEISNNFLENCYSAGYLPLFKKITRPNDNTGSCIDNFIVKSDLNLNGFIHTQLFTDHYPLICAFNTENNNGSHGTRSKHKIIKYNKLVDLISKVNWLAYDEIDDPNFAINTLIQDIQTCIENASFFPKKSQNKIRKSWLTPGILKCIKHKELLYKLWQGNKQSVILKSDYKKYEKILNKVLKFLKSRYEIEKAEKNCHDSKKMWSYINNKLGKKIKINKIEKIKNGDKIYTNATDMANEFNNFFINIGKEFANKLQSSNSNNNLSSPKLNHKSIYLEYTNIDEINTIIGRLKNRRGGIDDIHSIVLKNICFYINPVLVNIFNKCIYYGIWPDALKKAEVIPIHKSGEASELNNYRPISMVSNLAKIFEKIIHKRIYTFLIKHKRIHNNQFGFIKNKSSIHALDKVMDIIYNSLNDDMNVAATFIDLSKAFDTVDHNILYKKLYYNGIRGLALDLIKSYLSNRTQKVKLQNILSDEKTIELGVPQGTVLGPLLFTIYINDIFENDSLIFAYADDTVVLAVGKTWKNVQNIMNDKLAKINGWFLDNKLTVNTQKTEFVTFGCYEDSLPINMNIHMNNISIVRKEKFKYLGVILDQNVKWDLQINKLISKCRYFLYICKKLQHLPLKILQTIYNGFVYSILNYGISIWGGAYPTALQYLISLQNKFITLLKSDKIPTLEQLYKAKCILHHYESLNLLFTESTSRTRHKTISLPICKKTVFKKNSRYNAIYYFNRLTNELKDLKISDKGKFKKILLFIKQSQL